VHSYRINALAGDVLRLADEVAPGQPLAPVVKSWACPGALTSMLNWYRALLRYPPRPQHSRVTVPTLILWGAHDVALGRELAEPSCDLCDDGRLVFFEQASHWPHDEEPARVNRLLLRFLEGGTAAVEKDSIS
jgi:pimeloyl-ACP methyl ester carboxylesterase